VNQVRSESGQSSGPGDGDGDGTKRYARSVSLALSLGLFADMPVCSLCFGLQNFRSDLLDLSPIGPLLSPLPTKGGGIYLLRFDDSLRFSSLFEESRCAELNFVPSNEANSLNSVL